MDGHDRIPSLCGQNITPYYFLMLPVPLVQALLCVIGTSTIAFQLASLVLVFLFYMLISKCFKWSYSQHPKYAHFFACLKGLLWTWNSECYYPRFFIYFLFLNGSSWSYSCGILPSGQHSKWPTQQVALSGCAIRCGRKDAQKRAGSCLTLSKCLLKSQL